MFESVRLAFIMAGKQLRECSGEYTTHVYMEQLRGDVHGIINEIVIR